MYLKSYSPGGPGVGLDVPLNTFYIAPLPKPYLKTAFFHSSLLKRNSVNESIISDEKLKTVGTKSTLSHGGFFGGSRDRHSPAVQRQPRTQQSRLASTAANIEWVPSSLCLPLESQRGEVAPGLPKETVLLVHTF